MHNNVASTQTHPTSPSPLIHSFTFLHTCIVSWEMTEAENPVVMLQSNYALTVVDVSIHTGSDNPPAPSTSFVGMLAWWQVGKQKLIHQSITNTYWWPGLYRRCSFSGLHIFVTCSTPTQGDTTTYIASTQTHPTSLSPLIHSFTFPHACSVSWEMTEAEIPVVMLQSNYALTVVDSSIHTGSHNHPPQAPVL